MLYQDRYFSLLGDSISTLEGYSQPDFAAFYDRERKLFSGVLTPADTWWGRVIDALGGRLLVNNSFSGSTVCYVPAYEIESYGCSDGRTGSLHREAQNPDVILVYLGTNDWGCGFAPKPQAWSRQGDLSVFSVAYRSMLEKLRKNYSQAEIWCFTLAVSQFPDGEFPYRYRGWHMEEYCNVIRELAAEFGCRLIDLYRTAEPYEVMDDFHPTARGMQTLADGVMKNLT